MQIQIRPLNLFIIIFLIIILNNYKIIELLLNSFENSVENIG